MHGHFQSAITVVYFSSSTASESQHSTSPISTLAVNLPNVVRILINSQGFLKKS